LLTSASLGALMSFLLDYNSSRFEYITTVVMSSRKKLKFFWTAWQNSVLGLENEVLGPIFFLGLEVEELATTVVYDYFVVSPTPDNVKHVSVVK